MSNVNLQVGNVGLRQPITSKFDEFVQSAKSFFGRAIGWVRSNVSDRLAAHFQQAQQAPTTQGPTELTRSQVEKAIPSSHAAFTAFEDLAGTNRGGMSQCKVALDHVNTAARLLTGDIPMGGPEWTEANIHLTSCQAKLTEARNKLDSLIQSGHPNSAELGAVKAAVDDALQQVASRLAYLNNFSGSHALSQEKVCEARLGWAIAAGRVIDEAIASLPQQLQDPRAESLLQLKHDIVDTASKALLGADPNLRVEDGGNLKTISKDLGEQLSVAFKELGIPGKAKDLRKAVNQEHIAVLNNRNWDPIHGEIQFVHDGVPHTYSSDITPAGHLETLKTEYDGKGICCQSRDEAKHMVNMAKTSLKDEQGNTIFEGIRHGIVSAFGLNRTDRDLANHHRSEELLLGVIGSKPGLLQQALNQQPGETLELDISSINLLTPDPLRYYAQGKQDGKTDRAITQDQLRTLQAMDGKKMVLEFTDPATGNKHKVMVKPNIAAFSFGVNEGATRDGRLGVLMYYGGGKQSFNAVREDNRIAMNKLIGDPSTGDIDPNSKIGKFLRTASPADKKIVTELREQIRQMWNDDDYMAHGGDPHKMVARIAVLTHILGDTPCFNCKSGKDRTGTLDVEAKFLATRINFLKQQALASGANLDTTQLVPSPGPLNTSEKAMYRQFAIRSGNLEVQEFNTGIGGYKTGAQKALQARLGIKEAISRFIGGSKHVDA